MLREAHTYQGHDILNNEHLSRIEMFTLMAMDAFLEPDWTLEASTQEIANWTKFSVRTVRRALRRLEERGVITTQQRPGYKSIYTVTVPARYIR